MQTAARAKALRRPVWPEAGAAEGWSGPSLGSQGRAKEVKRELTPRSGPGDGMRGPFINVRTQGSRGVGQGWEREGSLEKKGEAERRARAGGPSTGSPGTVGGRPGQRESWRPRPCFREGGQVS